MMKFEHVILIHATAPLAVIRERCIEQKEELLQLDQISKCQMLFEEIVDRCHLPRIVYDSSLESPEDVIRKIKNLIQ